VGQHALPLFTSGWSAVGGLTSNPYRLDRCAGGSSSGSGAALAARLAPLAVGTETDGSITCPASLNGVAGIKPAVGACRVKASFRSPPVRTVLTDGPHGWRCGGTLRGAGRPGGRRLYGRKGSRDVRVAVATNLMTGHPATDAVFHEAVNRAREDGMQLSDIEVAEPDAEVGADEVTVLLSEMFDDLTSFLVRRGALVLLRSKRSSPSKMNTPTRSCRSSATSSSTWPSRQGAAPARVMRRPGRETSRGRLRSVSSQRSTRPTASSPLLQPGVEERPCSRRKRQRPLVPGNPGRRHRGMAHCYRPNGPHRWPAGGPIDRGAPRRRSDDAGGRGALRERVGVGCDQRTRTHVHRAPTGLMPCHGHLLRWRHVSTTSGLRSLIYPSSDVATAKACGQISLASAVLR